MERGRDGEGEAERESHQKCHVVVHAHTNQDLGLSLVQARVHNSSQLHPKPTRLVQAPATPYTLHPTPAVIPAHHAHPATVRRALRLQRRVCEYNPFSTNTNLMTPSVRHPGVRRALNSPEATAARRECTRGPGLLSSLRALQEPCSHLYHQD